MNDLKNYLLKCKVMSKIGICDVTWSNSDLISRKHYSHNGDVNSIITAFCLARKRSNIPWETACGRNQ